MGSSLDLFPEVQVCKRQNNGNLQRSWKGSHSIDLVPGEFSLFLLARDAPEGREPFGDFFLWLQSLRNMERGLILKLRPAGAGIS